MTICNQCRIKDKVQGEPILPNWQNGSQTLFLVDYPSPEDEEPGFVMAGLSKRLHTIYDLMEKAKVNPELISFASVLRCPTRSKAISFPDYKYCGQQILQEIEDRDIKIIMCFGSIAARLILGRQGDHIESLRGKSHNLIRENSVCVVSYTLSILSEKGCSGCGRTVYPYLMQKDMEILRHEMVKRRYIV